MAWIRRCCGCGVGRAATAPICPLAWEPLYALGAALKRKKKILVSCKFNVDNMAVLFMVIVLCVCQVSRTYLFPRSKCLPSGSIPPVPYFEGFKHSKR